MRKLIIIYSLMLLLTACSSSQSSFAYDSIIKYNNQIYVGSKEKTDKISKKIGQIEVYSDKEVDDSKGIFSNKYKVGTNLYEVLDEKPENVIAVEVGIKNYIKAYNLNYKTPGN
jgi:hypothetical protein